MLVWRRLVIEVGVGCIHSGWAKTGSPTMHQSTLSVRNKDFLCSYIGVVQVRSWFPFKSPWPNLSLVVHAADRLLNICLHMAMETNAPEEIQHVYCYAMVPAEGYGWHTFRIEKQYPLVPEYTHQYVVLHCLNASVCQTSPTSYGHCFD